MYKETKTVQLTRKMLDPKNILTSTPCLNFIIN